MVWHPNGTQLQGNNQCIPRPMVRLPMLPFHLSSPLEDTPCDVVGFAVTTSTTIAEDGLGFQRYFLSTCTQKRSTYVLWLSHSLPPVG